MLCELSTHEEPGEATPWVWQSGAGHLCHGIRGRAGAMQCPLQTLYDPDQQTQMPGCMVSRCPCLASHSACQQSIAVRSKLQDIDWPSPRQASAGEAPCSAVPHKGLQAQSIILVYDCCTFRCSPCAPMVTSREEKVTQPCTGEHRCTTLHRDCRLQARQSTITVPSAEEAPTPAVMQAASHNYA